VSYENLRLESADGLARITIDRPKVLNALNRATLEELSDALGSVHEDDAARVLIVTGAGPKAFVAGADINELAEMQPMGAKDLAYFGQSVLTQLERLGKPSIAMINGFALGGGCELALACTLRTASTTAKLGLPEVSLGILPGYGGTQRLARIAGPGVAREWILTADIYSAEEAHRVGVVNRVFSPEELEEGTLKLARTLLSRAPIAMRLSMEAVQRGMNMSQSEGEIIECDMFGLAATTQDMREGMTAFLEKRKADFQGR
jgi:enoyl-CoA hydratase